MATGKRIPELSIEVTASTITDDYYFELDKIGNSESSKILQSEMKKLFTIQVIDNDLDNYITAENTPDCDYLLHHSPSVGTYHSVWLQTGDNLGDARMTLFKSGDLKLSGGSFSSYGRSGVTSNTAIGNNALLDNLVGVNNVAIGLDALRYSNGNNNKYNIGIGNYALRYTEARNNIGIGFEALFRNISGSSNTAVGHEVMDFNVSGDNNNAFGYHVLYDNVSGNNNIGIGFSALRHTLADDNISIGNTALFTNTVGTGNVGIGTNALYSNVTNGNLTAIGYNALFNSVAHDNVGIGANVLYNNTTGNTNVGMGIEVLYSNITGSFNSAFGAYSLRANIADSNTAFGANSLRNNTTGFGCVAIGHDAVQANITGVGNTGVGYYVLRQALNTGNVALGYAANFDMTTATDTVAIGENTQALGDDSIAIGAFANTLSYTNSIAIGTSATTSANNELVLGDATVTSYANGGQIATVSDERDKIDIKDNNLGLDFISKIRTVEYKDNNRELYYNIVDKKVINPDYNPKFVIDVDTQEEILNPNYNPEFITDSGSGKQVPNPKYTNDDEEFLIFKEKKYYTPDGSKAGKRPHYGVIAQELKTYIDELGIDFAGYIDRDLKGEKLNVRYGEFIAPLIKSVQELSVENNNLKARIETLEIEHLEIKSRL